MREKDYYGAIKGFCLKWNLPEVWNSDRITGANLIYEVIKVINAMIVEQKATKEMIEDFLKMFDEDLSETVNNILIEWKDSGILEDIINETLFNMKLDKTVFEDYEIVVNQTLEDLDIEIKEVAEQLEQIAIDVTSPPEPLLPITGNGVESDKFIAIVEYVNTIGGTVFVPKDIVLTVDIITFENISNVRFDVRGKIKRKDNSQDGAVLRFKNSDHLVFEPLFVDGNGLNNGASPASEYRGQEQYNSVITLDNCHYVTFNRLQGHNSAGDIIYVTNGCTYIDIGTVLATADAQIGRNIVSLIDCQQIYIDNIVGRNFGHHRMPAGLDIEPNNELQSVQDVYVNNIDIVGSGMSPIALLASNNAISKNIYINNARIIRDVKYTPEGTPESVFITASDVTINQLYVADMDSTITPHFIRIDSHGVIPENITINNAQGYDLNTGIAISKYFNNAKNIYIKAKMRRLNNDGVSLTHGENIYLDLDIDDVGVDRYFVNKSGAYPTKDITITGNLSNRGDSGYSCFVSSVDPSFLINWKLIDLDLSGWRDSRMLFGNGFKGSVFKDNVVGLTLRDDKNNSSTYNIGDVITNVNPTILTDGDGDYIIDKWVYLDDSVRFVESKIYV